MNDPGGAGEQAVVSANDDLNVRERTWHAAAGSGKFDLNGRDDDIKVEKAQGQREHVEKGCYELQDYGYSIHPFSRVCVNDDELGEASHFPEWYGNDLV